MENIKFQVKGKTIIATINCGGKGKPSASGKTNVLASTRGNQAFDVDGKQVNVGINAFVKA